MAESLTIAERILILGSINSTMLTAMSTACMHSQNFVLDTVYYASDIVSRKLTSILRIKLCRTCYLQFYLTSSGIWASGDGTTWIYQSHASDS